MRKIVILACLQLAVLHPAFLMMPAQAADYEFTLIADTSGQFSSFGSASINDTGDVAFSAVLDSGEHGIFLGSGGAITTIADGSGLFFRFSSPRINANGTVVFSSILDSREEGVFTGIGGAITTVVHTSTGEFDGFRNPNINDDGTIVFHATLPRDPVTTVRHFGIFTISGETITTIADTSGPITTFATPRPVINADGTVAFSAEQRGSEVGIFTGTGGLLTTVIDTNGPFDGFASNLSINSAGRIAFLGGLDADGGGIFTIKDGAVSTIADNTGGGAYAGLDSPVSINDQNTVVFRAILTSGEIGIFAGADPVADKVILTGESLNGLDVTDVFPTTHQSINDNGSIVFRATLSDGSQGIYVATVSTPTAFGRVWTNPVTGDRWSTALNCPNPFVWGGDSWCPILYWTNPLTGAVLTNDPGLNCPNPFVWGGDSWCRILVWTNPVTGEAWTNDPNATGDQTIQFNGQTWTLISG